MAGAILVAVEYPNVQAAELALGIVRI